MLGYFCFKLSTKFSILVSSTAFSKVLFCFWISLDWLPNKLLCLFNSSNSASNSATSFIQLLTSRTFSFLLNSKYFTAFSCCKNNGLSWFSISIYISSILSKFSLVCFKFLSASCFLYLNLDIPQASSNTFLLLTGLLLSISSTLPCSTIEYPS